jgi:3-deoxy-D-arabino-heptulosonate 7-phosphate (DAHP) synthase
MEKVFVVKRVAEKLWATEDAIDGAMVEASVLMSGLVEARRELKLATTVTDPATQKLVEAIKALADARAAMTAAHEELNEVQLRLGVRVKMDKLHPPSVAPEAAELRAAR